MNKFKTILAGMILTTTIGTAFAHPVSLKFSDGKPDATGVEAVNRVLNTVGVNVTTHEIPQHIKGVLAQAQQRPLTEAEKNQVMEAFKLSRDDLIRYTRLAGRTLAVEGGGNLNPTEGGNGYPYIFDAATLNDEARKTVLEKYGRLHVNSADDGTDLDEVMTVVSGGTFRWAFTLKDGSVARLDVAPISPNDKAVRVAYHGLGMHAGIIDAQKGLLIGYGFGPDRFTIRYQAGSLPVAHAELLNTNPWIDYNYPVPKVVDTPVVLTK